MRTKSACLFSLMIFILTLGQAFASPGEKKVLPPDKSVQRYSPVLANTVLVRFKAGHLTKGSQEQTLSTFGGMLGEPLLPKNLSIKNNLNPKQNKLMSADKLAKIERAEEPLLRTFTVSYKGAMPPEKYCRYLMQNNPDVEIAEPVTMDRPLGSTNDPLIDKQVMLYTINAFPAWDICPGDTNVVIGISDVGIMQDHEDLKNSIAPNWGEIPDNGIDDDGNGYIDDYIGYNMAYKDDNTKPGDTYHDSDHGTYVAGIAGATINNGIGMAGTGGKCRIYPIKIGLLGETSLPYSYASIIYAAVRGVKVLNCSWGAAKSYSQIDQSVIDYAVSRDVAIVSAAGNWDNDPYEDWYPAGYRGVLGVGEVNQSDRVTSGSALGWQVGVMAPGLGDVGTTNTSTSSYVTDDQDGGTSWASPVVAGVVGIVRSRFPNLTAMQAIQYARQCTVDISAKNPGLASLGVLKGRIDMLRAVQGDPTSIPGFVPISYKFYDQNGLENARFLPGDTASLKINMHNYLAKAHDLRFVLSPANDVNNSISVIDSVVSVVFAKEDADLYLETFRFKLNAVNTSRIFLRIDIYGENNYHDYFLLPYTPTVNVTTFENDAIRFSVGDEGSFGFVGKTMPQGVGFIYKTKGNLLYRGGIIATENNQKLASSIYGSSYPDDNDFQSIKPFINPDKYTGIFDDSRLYEQNRIGLKIEQNFVVPNGNVPLAKVDIKVTNVSGSTLKDVSLGYYFDWDIGYNEDSNRVRLFPEALPASPNIIGAAELAEYTGTGFPVVGCLAYTFDQRGVAQAAGVNYDSVADIATNPARQVALINYGTSIQFPGIDDIKSVVGMKFPGDFSPDEQRSYTMIIGADEDAASLAAKIKDMILSTSAEDNNLPVAGGKMTMSVSPQPASDYIMLNFSIPSEASGAEIHIYNMLGNDVIEPYRLSQSATYGTISLDLRNVSPGTYFVRLINGSDIISQPVVVVR